MKNIVNDIKLQLNSETIKNKIVNDLGLDIKNGKCKCFIHNEKNPSMAFDNKHNRFKCFSCSATYDIFDHYQKYYTLSFVEALKRIVSDFNLSVDLFIKNEHKEPLKEPTIHDSSISKCIEYVYKRKISQETINYIGLKENNGCIVFEYNNEYGKHISNKYRPAKKLSKGDNKMWFEAGTNGNTLYNMDKINIDKPLIICEGEFDCMSLIESGIYNSVSVPTGCHSTEWIEVNWEFISQFNEVIICFDNDEAGKKGAKEVSSRLNNNIVKIASINKLNDINEVLYKLGKEAVVNIIRSAEMPDVDGVLTLDQIEDFDIYEEEKVCTGFKGIDDKIIGMLMGSLNTFTGENGAGKSTILNQIFIGEAMRQGFKVFIASGELTHKNVKHWIVRTVANEKHYVEATNRNNEKYKRVSTEGVSLIEKYTKDKLFLYSKDEYDINILLEKMEQMVRRRDVKVFIIDNLMTIECEIVEELKAQKYIVKKLKDFAKKYNVIVHLVAHPKKKQRGQEGLIKDDIAGSGNITNLSDYVTSIIRIDEDKKEQLENEMKPVYDAEFHVLKNRHTGTLPKIALKFDIERKRFYSNIQELNRNFGYYLEEYEKQENINFIQVEGEF